ncbi:unnamed protein product [Phaeothamnion confervicola]
MDTSYTILDDESSTKRKGRKRNMGEGDIQGRWSDLKIVLVCWVGLFVAGTAVGLVLPSSTTLNGRYKYVSPVMGWTYFFSWSLSFYPQVISNWRRKTTTGLSVDFQLLNLLGFACYAAFTCAFFWSATSQRAYERVHDGIPNKVEPNDVAFALHALALTVVTLGQIFWYDWRLRRQRPSRPALAGVAATMGSITLYAAVVSGTLAANAAGDTGPLSWLGLLYYLSYIKIGVSIVKYIPQVMLNHRRRSTVGWSVWNVILDLTGGLLSILQLLGDCAVTGDWSGISGYPAKFALGFVSIFFDAIFLMQHYICYRGAGAFGGDGEDGHAAYHGVPSSAEDADSDLV